MFYLVDSVGRKLFESISITLVCDECMKTEHPELCTHKLNEMPRWLSSNKMETVKALLSDDPVSPKLNPNPNPNSNPDSNPNPN